MTPLYHGMLSLSTTILHALLRIGEHAIDDAVAEARYRAVQNALGVTERTKLPQEALSHLSEWYTSTVMPARANRPSTRVQDARILTRLVAYLREQGVSTVSELAAKPNALNVYVLARQQVATPSTIL